MGPRRAPFKWGGGSRGGGWGGRDALEGREVPHPPPPGRPAYAQPLSP